jgi:V-type H+-transporting ATPase subunit H
MARSSKVGGSGALAFSLASSTSESKGSSSRDPTDAPYGVQHVALFLQPSADDDNGNKQVQLNCHPFVRALSNPDLFLQKSAALSLAFLLANLPGGSLSQTTNTHSMDSLVNWVVNKLKEATKGTTPGSNSGGLDHVMPALLLLCQGMDTRLRLLKGNCLDVVSVLLKKLGVTSNPQRLYELTFALWTFSLVSDVARAGEGDGAAESETTTTAFRSAGILSLLVDLLSAAPSRKIVRMVVSTLYNLARTGDNDLLTDIFNTHCLRHLETIVNTGKHRQVGDVEFENDVKGLLELLHTNHRELSTFERYSAELSSGELSWGIVHTEKFWKENCRFMEANDWATLKLLISYLEHPSAETQCIALYDLGEFARFFPNGRIVVKSLGAKDVALELIGSDSEEVSRQALACASKIMVNSWGMVLS